MKQKSYNTNGDDIYKRLRELREDNNMNQTQPVKKPGMLQTGYSKYETAENDIPNLILIKLPRLYNTSIDYILGENDRKEKL